MPMTAVSMCWCMLRYCMRITNPTMCMPNWLLYCVADLRPAGIRCPGHDRHRCATMQCRQCSLSRARSASMHLGGTHPALRLLAHTRTFEVCVCNLRAVAYFTLGERNPHVDSTCILHFRLTRYHLLHLASSLMQAAHVLLCQGRTWAHVCVG